jgi:energy-converting hydrogenase Eha subunit E
MANRHCVLVRGTPNCLNYCEMCIVHVTQSTNVGPRVGDPWFREFNGGVGNVFVPLILAQNNTTLTYGKEQKSVASLKCLSYIRHETNVSSKSLPFD